MATKTLSKLSLTSYSLYNAVSDSIANWSRGFILAALKRITIGEIIIKDITANETMQFGKSGKLSTTLTVNSSAMWWRVLSRGSLGFSEAYMLSEVDCDDMASFLEIMVYNRNDTADMRTPLSYLTSSLVGWARASNKPLMSLANVQAHYDLSNDMFAAFLSPDMTYSCPKWLPVDNAESKTDNLEKAQIRKLQEIIQQARIKETDHVLEIGTGWGSFAIEAVRSTGCRVTSLTLSIEQKQEAEARISAAGFEKNITVLLSDYRELPKQGLLFDKVVSIEMLEHVGKAHLPGYFATVNELLKKEGGIAVFQSSTMPETRYISYDKGNDFIRQYIFPGAHLPTATQMVEAAHQGSGGSLIPDRLINLGGHYSRCLRAWRENFADNFESHIVPGLLERNGGITKSDMEIFRKKWMFYFYFCEAGFKTKTLGVTMITFVREGSIDTLEGLVQ
ncbi:methoxy mycolic acid synthase [Trichoderma atroviride IMI 206040]|uniref:Methoxy mycolic acid synthase n=1 Tax=Hypocrea atroviridis (strain ATCC 20476 / IMI 206040) TaxID=452589 RepID=G9P7E4_HYPAI|nr:methoxy mycolic acid synthase [Trichoderma atroviride IMI 206040]EHK41590.1 methoxy mycolic acid synthase [Trichoderma atroviride IMI 206040]